MTLDEKIIRELYSKSLPEKYEKMQKHMIKYKKIAIDKSMIKEGDTVIVFCCGTGLDFNGIEKRVKESGRIIGVDFSKEMLKKAEKNIINRGWNNIELVNEDVTKYKHQKDLGGYAHAGICTLGISIIPNYQQAFYNLLSFVKLGGEIILGDMQLATGINSIFNPITIYLSKPFGGSKEGHKNSHNLYQLMKKELRDVNKEEYLLKSYFIAWGKKN